MKPLRFYWIRHATPINPDNICYGDDMDVDVTDIQSLDTQAARLPDGAKWYVSPIFRAAKTAAALRDRRHDGASIACLPAAALREQSFGDWVGLKRSQLPAQPGFAEFKADVVSNAPPNGENLKSLAARVDGWITGITADNPNGGDIVTISHKGTIRAALHSRAAIALPDTIRIDIAPLSITVLSYDYNTWTLETLNLKP